MSEPDPPRPQDRLRLVDALLRAMEDSVASLQRLLAEVSQEMHLTLRGHSAPSRDEELLALRRELDQIREGMASRAVIEQAKGVLMSTNGLSESQAFDYLTEMSQRRRRKLRDVAADVVASSPTSRLAATRSETQAARRVSAVPYDDADGTSSR